MIVNELRDSELTQYQTTCIAFINALLLATENFDERVRLRNEFIGKYALKTAIVAWQKLPHLCISNNKLPEKILLHVYSFYCALFYPIKAIEQGFFNVQFHTKCTVLKRFAQF